MDNALLKIIIVLGGTVALFPAIIGALKWFWWALFVFGPWIALTGAIAWFMAVVFGKKTA